MKKVNEFSENYLQNGLGLPKRQKGEDISSVFNGPILAYWLETKQCLEDELSEEQKYYAGIKKP